MSSFRAGTKHTGQIWTDCVGAGMIFKTIRDLSDTQGGFTWSSNAGPSLMALRSNASGTNPKLGIGTNPAYTLDVNGEIHGDALALDSNTPGTTTNKLYNNSGFLKFNGDNVPLSTDTTVKDIRVMTLASYNSLSPKDANTLYFVY